jgi:hypothetical protein
MRRTRVALIVAPALVVAALVGGLAAGAGAAPAPAADAPAADAPAAAGTPAGVPDGAVKLATIRATRTAGSARALAAGDEVVPECTVWAYPPTVTNLHRQVAGEAVCNQRAQRLDLTTALLRHDDTIGDFVESGVADRTFLSDTATVPVLTAVEELPCKGSSSVSWDPQQLFRNRATLYAYFGPEWNQIELNALTDYVRLSCP